MQYILAFLVLIALVIFIIYRVNDKFEKREFLILIVVLVLTIGGFLMYENNQEEKLPQLFKQKYETSKDAKIEKLSYELLNNKNISSRSHFEYKFVYIIKKDNKEFLCTASKVDINKVGDEYIFNSFKTLEEKCEEQ